MPILNKKAMTTQLSLNDASWESIEILLSPDELDDRRIKNAK
jgi:hypothetical protein